MGKKRKKKEIKRKKREKIKRKKQIRKIKKKREKKMLKSDKEDPQIYCLYKSVYIQQPNFSFYSKMKVCLFITLSYEMKSKFR